MTTRVAALLALLAFAGAWIVGVWCQHAPGARLWNAALAGGCGALAGAAIGFAMERIVLERMSERWDGGEGVLAGAPPAEPGAAGPAAPAAPAGSAVAKASSKAAPAAELAETRR